MESIFLQAALASSTSLKIVLRKGIEMSGTIQDIGKYEISYLVDGVVHTTPKKEIAYFRCESTVFQPTAAPKDQTAEQAAEQDLQSTILSGHREHKKLVAVNLIGGGSQWGMIIGYDPFTILLGQKHGQTLVYKHGVASVTEVRKNRPATGKAATPTQRKQENVGEKPDRGPASTGTDK